MPDPGAHPPERDTPLALVAHELKASYAFVERNFFLTRRYWGWEVAFLVYSVAGALSISPDRRRGGRSDRLLLTLIIGAVFWNYLSVVFSWIAETIAVERWEGTLEYTFMAPVRRWTQLLGSCVYAMGYGVIHTAAMLVVLADLLPGARPGRDQPGHRRGLRAPRLVQLRGHRDDGRDPAAALRGARGADDLRAPVVPAARVRRLLPGRASCPAGCRCISKLSPATYVLDGVRAGLLDGTPLDGAGRTTSCRWS